MSKNYAMVNGVKIELPDDVDELTFTRKPVEKEQKSPFARLEKGEEYFRIEISGKVKEDTEAKWKIDDDCYSVANYCTDKTMMEQRALHETLNRLLWKYSEEHGGDNEWDNDCKHWGIYKRSDEAEPLACYSCVAMYCGAIFFKDKETAQSAIEEIVKPFMAEHPDFVW